MQHKKNPSDLEGGGDLKHESEVVEQGGDVLVNVEEPPALEPGEKVKKLPKKSQQRPKPRPVKKVTKEKVDKTADVSGLVKEVKKETSSSSTLNLVQFGKFVAAKVRGEKLSTETLKTEPEVVVDEKDLAGAQKEPEPKKSKSKSLKKSTKADKAKKTSTKSTQPTNDSEVKCDVKSEPLQPLLHRDLIGKCASCNSF